MQAIGRNELDERLGAGLATWQALAELRSGLARHLSERAERAMLARHRAERAEAEASRGVWDDASGAEKGRRVALVARHASERVDALRYRVSPEALLERVRASVPAKASEDDAAEIVATVLVRICRRQARSDYGRMPRAERVSRELLRKSAHDAYVDLLRKRDTRRDREAPRADAPREDDAPAIIGREDADHARARTVWEDARGPFREQEEQLEPDALAEEIALRLADRGHALTRSEYAAIRCGIDGYGAARELAAILGVSPGALRKRVFDGAAAIGREYASPEALLAAILPAPDLSARAIVAAQREARRAATIAGSGGSGRASGGHGPSRVPPRSPIIGT